MYLGRIVAVGVTKIGKIAVLYRVSSRSFPNREAKISENTASIIPKPGFENDIRKNPYIAYNCAKVFANFAILSNGSHTDPIAEKISSGMHPRDAIALSLITLDYEKDQYSTPRIVAVADRSAGKGYLGFVSNNAVGVSEVEMSPGRLSYVSTYEHNYISREFRENNFDISDGKDACKFILSNGIFEKFENPVSAVSALDDGKGFLLSSLDINDLLKL